MADAKWTTKTAATSVSTDGLFLIVEDPAGTPVSKKITAGNVATSISTLLSLGDSATLDVGAIAGTVAAGNHNHTGVYEPANANLLETTDIGVSVQGYDADLSTIAGLTATTDNFMQAKSSAWASRTPTQVTADLIAVIGDSGSGGTKGLVPAPAAGDAAAGKFLKADGTWTAPSGSGDVVGPASATDNAIARFDGTTGKLIQNSAATVADTTGDITAGKYNTVAISGSSTPTLAVTGTTAVSGTNTGDQNLFSTIAVSGQSNVVADAASDTLTLVAGTNVTITTDASTDSITIAASGGSGGGTKTYAVFTPSDNQPPATNFATLDTRNSIAVLDFDTTTEEVAIFVGIIPEAASLGSGLIVKIHWMATSATSGDCRWGAQFQRNNTDLDSDSFDTATEGTSTTNGTSGIITVTSLTCTTIDSVAAGDSFRLKIYRDVSDAADTMAGDAELVAVEVRSAA